VSKKADTKKPQIPITMRYETRTRIQGEESKRVGIWIRVSTEDQAKGESPEHHEARARMYAEMKGWEVITVYHLEGVSGKSVVGFPEAKRMLEDVAAGRIDALIFSKLARLARNTRELLDIADHFKACGAALVSLQESIDTSTAAGTFFYTLLGAMGQWERDEASERVAASVPIRAKLGKPIGGTGPFGYRWQDGKLLPDENEAPVRKLMYDLFLTHKRIKTVARLLNEAGHRTRKGKPFPAITVDRLIRDPTAKGLHRANYSRFVGGKFVLKPEHEWVHVEVPAIVSEETWTAANAILDARRVTGKPPAKRAVHLFAGLAFCECGAKLYVPSNNPKYVCIRKGCHTKIAIEDLERVFIARLRDFILAPEEIARHLEAGDRVLEEREALHASLEREKARVVEEMDKLYRLYLDDQLTSDAFGRRNRPLDERFTQLEAEIPRLMGEIDFLRAERLSSHTILTGMEELTARWPSLPLEGKREIVEHLVERITLGKEEVTIDLTYRPTPDEIVTKGIRSPSGW
jgi:site-specific DNA recombinase